MNLIKTLSGILLIQLPLLCDAQLKIFQSGNISLGSITAPVSGSRIQVIGNSVFSASNSTIISSAFIRGLNAFSGATNPDYTWYNNDQVGMFHPALNVMGFSTNGTERMRIDPNGYVGIGVTNPSYRLDLAHSFRLTTWTAVIWDGSGPYGAQVLYPASTWNLHLGKSSQKIGDGHFFNVLTDILTMTSDERVKANIKELGNPMDRIKKIKTVTYNLNDNYLSKVPEGRKKVYQKLQIGFLAQNIMEIFPEMVDVVDSASGTLGVRYFQMIPVLTAGMQQQQEQLDNIQKTLDQCCKIFNSGLMGNVNLENVGEPENIIASAPDKSYLFQNNPNPFNIKTAINYYIPSSQSLIGAQILVFNMQGALIKAYMLSSTGKGALEIQATELGAGMYMYSLIVNGKEVDTKRMILTH